MRRKRQRMDGWEGGSCSGDFPLLGRGGGHGRYGGRVVRYSRLVVCKLGGGGLGVYDEVLYCTVYDRGFIWRII